MTRIQPIHILVRIVVLGAAVWAAVRLAPGFRFPSAEEIPAGGWVQLAAVAVIFGMLNAYLKPVLKALSWPVELVTLGLLTWVINAALLLLLAWVADAFSLGLRLGAFPPHFGVPAIVAALAGSLVISVVSLVLSMVFSDLVPERPSWRTRLGL